MSHTSTFLLVGCWLISAPASATQPLADFIGAARRQSFDAREQAATAVQRDWEAEAAKGRLLPALNARGSFTHNQFEAGVPAGTFPGQTADLVITPQNQLDATFQLDVPLIDLSNYARFDQAKHLAKAAVIGQEATGTELDRAVAQAYFTFVGSEALADAARRSIQIAEENLAYVRARAALGAATQLDEARAESNVELSRQELADAELLRITAGRNLNTLSGIEPSPVTAYPVDDLRHEPPLESWLAQKDTPLDRVQQELSLAAASGRKAAARALLPTLSASAQERLSNATGFTGQNAAYALMATLSWRLDYATYANAKAAAAAADVQDVRTEKTRRAIEDTIFEAYHRVETSIVKSQSARAQSDAARKAADLSIERYKAGAVTQLDVTQSQREAFAAQARRIKADADLAFARVLLRIAAGQPAEATAFTLAPKTDISEPPAPAAPAAAGADASAPGAAPPTQPPSPPQTGPAEPR